MCPSLRKCKYSQLHMSVKHDTEHVRTERKTKQLQPTHTRVGPLSKGHPALCDTPVGPGRTPTVHGGPYAERPWVARQLHDVTTDKRHTTEKGLETNVLSVNKFRMTLQPSANQHLGTYMVADRFAKPEIHGKLSNSVNEHVVNRVEVETSRIIKKINQEKINHKTKYINISQNQYTDKVVDVIVVIQKQVSHRIKRRTERVGDLSWTSDTVNMRVHVQGKTPENESPLRKAHERERYASCGRG